MADLMQEDDQMDGFDMEEAERRANERLQFGDGELVAD